MGLYRYNSHINIKVHLDRERTNYRQARIFNGKFILFVLNTWQDLYEFSDDILYEFYILDYNYKGYSRLAKRTFNDRFEKLH